MAEFDPQKQSVVNAILQHGTLKRACTAAGVNRREVYRWRQDDPAFDAEVREALTLVKQGDVVVDEDDEESQTPDVSGEAWRPGTIPPAQFAPLTAPGPDECVVCHDDPALMAQNHGDMLTARAGVSQPDVMGEEFRRERDMLAEAGVYPPETMVGAVHPPLTMPVDPLHVGGEEPKAQPLADLPRAEESQDTARVESETFSATERAVWETFKTELRTDPMYLHNLLVRASVMENRTDGPLARLLQVIAGGPSEG